MAANMLHRAGHEVTVLEKTLNSLDGRGAGIVTHKPLATALVRCGVASDARLGIAIDKRVLLDRQGDIAAQVTLPQVLTSWSRLYTLLLAAFPAKRYVQGASVNQVSQSHDCAMVTCDDGRTFEAEIVVASDGIRSGVRASLAPQVEVKYAGYVAWRGVCDESALSDWTLRSVFETFGFGLPPGEQIIGYPVAGAGNSVGVGQRRYNFVWYRPAPDDGVLQSLMTDADGHHHLHGLPPNKVSWKHVASVRQAARERLAPQFADILEKTTQPFLQPIYDFSSERIAFDRVALMGDAAFVARPHVGMGVTKAAEDAMALTDCIVALGANALALQAFEALRLKPGQAAVERARRLGAYMQASASPGTNLDTLERDARAVLMDTAIDLSTVPLQNETKPDVVLN
jgi:2-polyprenyl-6-methoxyphenol hydroxylase-like FAD-dependent oxidoreductase